MSVVRLHRIVLANGLGTSVHRGMGGVIEEKNTLMWYANGFVWVKPLVNTGNGMMMRCYHPSSCEMYPYEEDAPPIPAAPELKAVGGSKK